MYYIRENNMQKIILCLLSIVLSSTIYAAVGDAGNNKEVMISNNPSITTEAGKNSDTEMDNNADEKEDVGISTSTTPEINNEPAGDNPVATPAR